MKRSIIALASALALWGCASNSGTERASAEDDNFSPVANDVEQARESREESDMTVYDESATGGSGQHESVTTDEGVRWDTQEEPRGDEPSSPGQNSVDDEPSDTQAEDVPADER